MKKLIIALGLISHSVFGQDTLVEYFGNLINENEYQQVVKSCFNILDTAKTDANKQLANIYIAVALERQGKLEGSLEYSFTALRFKGPNTERALNNIGCIFARKGNYSDALLYFNKTLPYLKGDNRRLAEQYGNIAVIHTQTKHFKDAEKAVDAAFNIAPKDYVPMLYLQKGDIYFFQENFKAANEQYYKCLALNPRALQVKLTLFQSLAESYAHLNVSDSTIKYYDKYNEVADLIRQERSTKDVNDLFVKYETKDKERQLEIQTAKVDRQKRFIFLSILAGIVLIIILIIIHQLYLRVKRKNKTVEEQNKVINAHQKEMIDSINYASGIQAAILPMIKDPNVFTLYKPKDIVSGDFFWTAEKHGRKYYAVCDCTGHGVPGALLAMLCSQLLDNALTRWADANQIVKDVYSQLDRKMRQMGRNDSMEIALVSIEGNKAEFAGLGRSLYHVSNGVLNQIKDHADLTLLEGDMLYMTTDGFYDQFGMSGKKFGSKRLKEEFTMTANVTDVEAQGRMLEATLNYWMQDVEQTDDILVMGIRI